MGKQARNLTSHYLSFRGKDRSESTHARGSCAIVSLSGENKTRGNARNSGVLGMLNTTFNVGDRVRATYAPGCTGTVRNIRWSDTTQTHWITVEINGMDEEYIPEWIELIDVPAPRS